MRKAVLSLILVAGCCCCFNSCTEKSADYKLVKIQADGKELVETIDAKNDTDAVVKYIDRMEKIILEGMDNKGPKFEAMYVISPKGDTLNNNEELMKAALKPLPLPADVEEPTAK